MAKTGEKLLLELSPDSGGVKIPSLDLDSIPKAPLLCSTRLNVFLVFLLATFSFLLQRLIISFALVCMVKSPVVNITELEKLEDERVGMAQVSGWSEWINQNYEHEDLSCYSRLQNITSIRLAADPSSIHDQGDFYWSKEDQSGVLASFYYGFLFTLFGGWVSEKLGGKMSFLGSLAFISLGTLSCPLAARHGGNKILSVIRFIQGFTHGAALPCINVLAARWCSITEQGFLMSIAYGGFPLAAAVTFPISAFLCEHLGWDYIFYVPGFFSLIILFLGYFMITEWPEKHTKISELELIYLQHNRCVHYSSKKSPEFQRLKVPWKKLLTCPAANVIHLTHFCFTFGLIIVGMYLPTFMKEVLHVDTTTNGMFSAMPYVGMLLTHFLVGSIFDFFRKKNFCTLTTLRKIFNTLGMLGPSIAIALIGFVPCGNPMLGMVAVTIGHTFGEFAFMGGYLFSIYEVAPRYAGILTGIANTFAVVPGFICPAMVSWMTPNGSREEWIIVFIISASVNIFGGFLYLIFGSSELRPWAAQAPPTSVELEPMNKEGSLPSKLSPVLRQPSKHDHSS